MTLHRASLESARLYGTGSPFHIPHTLYYSLESSASFRPSLAQICALSRISGYRFEDWLEALGINFERLSGLQAVLPFRKSRLLDPALNGEFSPVLELHERANVPAATGIVPLGQRFRLSSRAAAVRGPEHFPLFARVGPEDSLCYPELLPGSIVRLSRDYCPAHRLESDDGWRGELLIVEHARGLWCGRFRLSKDGFLCSVSAELACPPVMLRYPRDVRILGRVDLEIRWMHHFDLPWIASPDDRRQISEDNAPGPGSLIRRARIRANMTLEEAARLSQRVAQVADDRRYSIAQSTLSDYEAGSTPPRHLEKVIALCLIYGVPLADFVAAAAGVDFRNLGHRVIPAELITGGAVKNSRGPDSYRLEEDGSSGFLPREIGAIPWFLASRLAVLSGIARPSQRDFFWLSGRHHFLPSHTSGSIVALVDRRRKHPVLLPERPAWLQPAYVLLLRNGTYRCACCSLDDQNLLLCPNPQNGEFPETLRLGHDAEVVGQIVALARRVE